MLQYMKSRIALQDTFFNFEDLAPIATIGRGSCGIIQSVSHKKKQVRYALKCVPKRTLKENNQELGFMTERRILMEIDHPFLLKIVKTFKTPSYLFMVTELVTGGDLYSAIRCLGIL